MLPDHILVTRALEGDAGAFEELVNRYEAKIRQLAHGYLRRSQAAEDVAQDSFVQAWEKLGTLGDPQAFRSWLYRIAINRCHDELRRAARETELPGDEEVDAELRRSVGPPTSEQIVESRELGHELRAALAALPKKHREPLVLKEVQGMTYAEIAELLGWPVGTVQIRIHRARLRLRERLKRLAGYAAKPAAQAGDARDAREARNGGDAEAAGEKGGSR